jgi:hypothetical protein
MGAVVNYLICTVALFVAIVLTCSGGWFSVAGLCFDGLLFVSGELFPNVWKSFWISNIRILSYFGSL